MNPPIHTNSVSVRVSRQRYYDRHDRQHSSASAPSTPKSSTSSSRFSLISSNSLANPSPRLKSRSMSHSTSQSFPFFTQSPPFVKPSRKPSSSPSSHKSTTSPSTTPIPSSRRSTTSLSSTSTIGLVNSPRKHRSKSFVKLSSPSSSPTPKLDLSLSSSPHHHHHRQSRTSLYRSLVCSFFLFISCLLIAVTFIPRPNLFNSSLPLNPLHPLNLLHREPITFPFLNSPSTFHTSPPPYLSSVQSELSSWFTQIYTLVTHVCSRISWFFNPIHPKFYMPPSSNSTSITCLEYTTTPVPLRYLFRILSWQLFLQHWFPPCVSYTNFNPELHQTYIPQDTMITTPFAELSTHALPSTPSSSLDYPDTITSVLPPSPLPTLSIPPFPVPSKPLEMSIRKATISVIRSYQTIFHHMFHYFHLIRFKIHHFLPSKTSPTLNSHEPPPISPATHSLTKRFRDALVLCLYGL